MMNEIFDGLGYYIFLGTIVISSTWIIVTLINKLIDFYIYKHINNKYQSIMNMKSDQIINLKDYIK